MSLYCGTSKIEITPGLGTPLAGYAGDVRKADAVHDPLYARVMAIKSEEKIFLLISLDLVGTDQVYTQKLATKIDSAFDIPTEQIFVHATHTHSAPGGLFDSSSLIGKAYPYMNGYLPFEDEIINKQHEQILQAIKKAITALEACTLHYGEGTVEGIAANRNNPDLPYDYKLRVLEFRYASGQKAILYHFASHPTIMHAENTSISADLPGAASRILENQEDVQSAFYLNGPSADVSTRFTRTASSFSEVERLGKQLADGVLEVLSRTGLAKIADSPVKTGSREVELAVRKIADKETLEKQLADLQNQYQQMETESSTKPAELRQLQSRIEGMETSLKIGDRLEGISSVLTSLQALRIGSLVCISIPGELYFEAGKQISQSFEFPILVLGNTNDHLGYLIPKRYYEEQHYESFMTLLEKGSNEKVVETAIQLIEEITA